MTLDQHTPNTPTSSATPVVPSIIESISLVQGPPSSTVEVPCGTAIIFVGPNNSGKSLALRNLYQLITREAASGKKLVVSAKPRWWSREELLRFLLHPKPLPPEPKGHDTIELGPTVSSRLAKPSYDAIGKHLRERDETKFLINVLQYLSVFLTGQRRFNILEPKDAEPLTNPPKNPLDILHRDIDTAIQLDKMLYDAFNLHFVVDFTQTKFVIRISQNEIAEEIRRYQSFKESTARILASMEDISATSDGVKQYLSMLIALHVGNSKILILDEPEVFLHPPLIRQLASHMTKAMYDRRGNLFVGTHSPDFLLGVVQSGVPFTVIRLGYRRGISTVRNVEPARLVEIFNKPILRSANAATALFADGAVVTEADRDLVLYETAHYYNERSAPTGMTLHFVNARQKHTARRFVEPLRELGVPTAAIVDFDVIKKNDTWGRLLQACRVPSPLVEGLKSQRAQIEKSFTNKEDMNKGIYGLEGANREAAEHLISNVREYGLFVVPGGELESWLKSLDVGEEDKQRRVTAILERLGESGGPNEEELKGDIWRFVADVSQWIRDPQRKGMGPQ